MKKQVKRISLLLIAVIAALFLSGCGNSDGSGAATETQQQTAAAVTSSVKDPADESTGYNLDGIPAYPLPDGWTFEKIVNLVEIDGVQLSLLSDEDDFNNINKNIKAVRDENFKSYYDVFYKDESIISIRKIDEKKSDGKVLWGCILGYFGDDCEIIDTVTFAGHSLRDIDGIFDFMDEKFILSLSGDSGRRYLFIEDNRVLRVSFIKDSIENPTAVSLIITIKKINEEENTGTMQ